jgi:hypothetical protein
MKVAMWTLSELCQVNSDALALIQKKLAAGTSEIFLSAASPLKLAKDILKFPTEFRIEKIRSTKLETNSNDRNSTNSKRAQIGVDVLDFPDLGFILASVCFGPRGLFRNSDFEIYVVGLLQI